MTEKRGKSIGSRPPTLPHKPISEDTDEVCHVCKMFVRPSAFLSPDAQLSVPIKHPDPSELDSKRLKTKLPLEKTELACDYRTKGKGYTDLTDVLPADAIEPLGWGWGRDCRLSSDEIIRLQRAALERKLRISVGHGVTGVSHAEVKYAIFEIFSVSIHWKEKENVGGKYHLYGNVFVKDCDDCFLTAMKRSPQHPFIVSNGDNLPLRGLDRCLWCDQFIHFFVCLMGHRFESGGKCCDYESPILIKKNLILNEDIKEDIASPIERTFTGANGNHFFKIHYSVMYPFIVGVEVRLVCPDENHFVKNMMIRIWGKLSVYWHRHVGGGRHNYTISLLDTEQQDSLSSSSSSSESTVRLGERFPLWRHKVAVPSECELVFDADIKTDSGEVFKGTKSIEVDDNLRVVVLPFGGKMLNMQITLLNYYC